jgi:hypothetical protein
VLIILYEKGDLMKTEIKYFVYLHGESHPIVAFSDKTGGTAEFVAGAVYQLIDKHDKLLSREQFNACKKYQVDGVRLDHYIRVNVGGCGAVKKAETVWETTKDEDYVDFTKYMMTRYVNDALSEATDFKNSMSNER